ncbi:unnamed protein product [Angiostrongylus costaricensis]|uniref:Receptor expression-enhancing protein n=1 Tax=Angiostrongylus costaricensis TaxID=334426 RepID=A0A0R3PVT0_ANGCS|nr:unnamed protein product [Angiostrongylus costaricensis]
MFSLLCQLASVFVGAVVPAFYSYKTIKRPSQKNLSYWSKYWTVFGSFLVVDVVLSTLFIHYFIPFYELGKLVFLIWAVNPQTAGAIASLVTVLPWSPVVSLAKVCPRSSPPEAVTALVGSEGDLQACESDTRMVVDPGIGLLSAGLFDGNAGIHLSLGDPSSG